LLGRPFVSRLPRLQAQGLSPQAVRRSEDQE